MSEIEVLEREIAALRQQLKEKESTLTALQSAANKVKQVLVESKQKLSNEDIGRYARQIILPEMGVRGQLALKNASILIVGAGGLGMYSSQLIPLHSRNDYICSIQVVHRHCTYVALVLAISASSITIQ